MSVMVPIKDGKVVDTNTNSDSQEQRKAGGSLDKQAFLQLLVAQMKYQDPLEPTSNTEYVSQLATFSSLEQMQNLNATMQVQQGTNLVGKTVIMQVTQNGSNNYVQGRVDYVVRQGGKTYLSIDDQLYSIEDLDKVIDDEYLDALGIAEDFEKVIGELPDVKNLTIKDKEKLEAVRKAFNNLTTYQQEFIQKYCKTAFQKLSDLVAKMKELDKDSDTDDGDDKDDGEGTEGTGGSGSTGGTEGTGGSGSTGGTEGTGGSGSTNG